MFVSPLANVYEMLPCAGYVVGAKRTQGDFAGRNVEHVRQEIIRVKMKR